MELKHTNIMRILILMTHYAPESRGYAENARRAYEEMSPECKAALDQLVNHGPVSDGDVISKACRDDLLGFSLASRACIGGEQGWTVANYRGWDVLAAGTRTGRFA